MLESLHLSPIIVRDGINISDSGIRQLGVPVGSPQFVQAFIEKKTQRIIHLLQQVDEMVKWEEEHIEINYHNPERLSKSTYYYLPGKQVALLLYRTIFNSFFSFLFRTCTPAEMAVACDEIEGAFKVLFTSSFQLRPLSPLQWQQVFSPFRFGGLGFSPLGATAVSAFAASSHYFLLNNAHLLLPSSVIDTFLSSSSPLALAFQKAQSVVAEVIASSSASAVSSAPLTRDSLKQHHVADFSAKQRHNSLLAMMIDPVEKFRLTSLASHEATSFLVAIPSSPALLISSPLFPIVLSNFLGLPFPRCLPLHCLCGAELEPSHFEVHLQTCKHRGSPSSHNTICSTVSSLARQGGDTVSGPAQISHLDSRDARVADFRIKFAVPSSIDTIVDVSIRNTLAPSSFSSDSLPRPVLQYAAHHKTEHHGPAASSISSRFVPFILDRFGNLEAEAKTLFNRLISDVPPDIFEPENWAACSVASYWHQRLCVAVWSSLARESLVFSVRMSNAAAC